MTFLHKLFIFITIFVLFLLSLLDIKNKVAISTNLITGTFLCTKHKYILILIKISHCISSTYIFCPQRAYSSKTRIKTKNVQFTVSFSTSQRAYSSKTRIKTKDHLDFSTFLPNKLKEHIPVKQGLRPCLLVTFVPIFASSKSIFQ